jgi:DNA (cytosine-5)-methyltransferase 1
MSDKIRVIELFAGVGGFRLGLERASDRYTVVWSNQWEPSTKVQHASEIYVKNFGRQNHHNCDIAKVAASDIPDHDLLVGGFPCQDYSVARTLNHAMGLRGKKGVLWWEIYRIAEAKRPKYLFLENVDRLLKSPASERGRDFAIMLASLSDLGYTIEWRMINAGDYGMPQRRRRVFIFAFHKTSAIYSDLLRVNKPLDWIKHDGIFAQSFPIHEEESKKINDFRLDGEPEKITENFRESIAILEPLLFEDSTRRGWHSEKSPFENAGLLFDQGQERHVWTVKPKPLYDGEMVTLGDVLMDESEVDPKFYLNGDLSRWEYLKGSKSEPRRNKATGFEYEYSEGPMVFPDPLDEPSRTIITGEGGPSPSRFKHVIQRNEGGPYRRLTPEELEKLNMFPLGHTQGVSDVRRAYFMGNALVVGIVETAGREIARRI